LKVVVGSANLVKVRAVKEALEELGIEAEVEALEVPSGVPPLPVGEEVFRGAENRASAAAERGDVGVGLESGLFLLNGKLFMISVAAVKAEGLHFGLSPGFELPESWAPKVLKDTSEFYKMMEAYGGRELGKGKGLVGVLTKGVVTRKDFCKMAVIMAFSKAFNEVWR